MASTDLNSAPADSRNTSVRRGITLAALLIGGMLSAGLLVYASRHFFTSSSEELLADARLAMARGDFSQADNIIQDGLRKWPSAAPLLVLAGQRAAEQGRPHDAVRYYDQVSATSGQDKIVALGASADLLLREGYASAAEKRYRQLLAIEPRHVLGNRRLASLLVAEGRRWESAPLLFELIRQQEYTIEELALLGNLQELFEAQELLEFFVNALPDDKTPQIGIARVALHKNETSKAEKILHEVIAEAPHSLEAHANLGKIVATQGAANDFARWHASLPADADSHPDIWMVRGTWAQTEGDLPTAIRCYWESLRLDPNHARSCFQLGQCLVAAGKKEHAAPFLERAEQLERFRDTIRPVLFKGATTELQTLLQAAQQAEELGRAWEAWAWYNAAFIYYRDSAVAKQERLRLAGVLTPVTPQVLASANPTLKVDLTSYPLPRWTPQTLSDATDVASSSKDSSSKSKQTPSREVSALHFTDDAVAAGLDFTYFNSDDPSEPGMQIYQSMGGGIAAMDYDGDAWPDMYFAQGCVWPPQPGQNEHVDRLFRNRGDGRFEDVTVQAGVGDDQYGQGVAVGDYDSDGFADLRVGNIGPNRLYRNNGDGTFTDVAEEAEVLDQLWTTSTVLADFSGDGLPDVYDASYLAGDRPFQEMCPNHEYGVVRSCKPTLFPAEDDQLFINLGNGRFEDVSERSGIRLPDARGMGVVAARTRGSGMLDLLVANDMTPNFYFRNEGQPSPSVIQFRESGYFAGLAVDFEGKSQASMGIAADDADGNGLLDLFITNFYNESNTLYLQQSAGVFTDATRHSGLREPSLQQLGFGTQFLDAELDGWPDLVVTNGHIDDFRFEDIPYQMQPQYFSNLGNADFVEVAGDELGEYFQRPYLGRGLTKLDWNRDGREDFIVSHLDAPVALVTNRTASVGNFLAVQLRGTRSCRDAVGTTVQISIGDRTWVKQLTAGDGYLASNQRQLVFGLGLNDRIDRLTVHWPTGEKQEYVDLPTGVELILVEGQSEPIAL